MQYSIVLWCFDLMLICYDFCRWGLLLIIISDLIFSSHCMASFYWLCGQTMVLMHFSGICIAGDLTGISWSSAKAKTLSFNEYRITPCNSTVWACREGPRGQKLECEPAVCSSIDQGQQHPVLHWEEHCQHIKVGHPLRLLRIGGTHLECRVQC